MNAREQSILAGQCVVKVESILKLCGLEQVMITRMEDGERKEYIALDEIKEAIRLLNKLAIIQEERNEDIHSG